MEMSKERMLCVLTAAVLSACGGGGGGSGDGGGGLPPPPPAPAPAPGPGPAPAPGTVNANNAWRNFLTTTQAWTVSGTGSNGLNYQIALSLTPGPRQTFPLSGVQRSTTTARAELKPGGLAIQTNEGVTYFDLTSYVADGTKTTDSTGASTCSTATASSQPPESAAIGASGPLQSYVDYNGCLSSSAVSGSSVTTWSVESENNITYFCLNTVAKNNAGAVLTSEGDCFQIDANGTFGAKARVTLHTAMFDLIARN